MRNDLVEKYQYYMTEAARLLELVNEQDAYITKLEEALDALSEGNEEAAQDELSNVDSIMAEIMPGIKAKNRPPMMKPKKPVDHTALALKLKAQEELEK